MKFRILSKATIAVWVIGGASELLLRVVPTFMWARAVHDVRKVEDSEPGRNARSPHDPPPRRLDLSWPCEGYFEDGSARSFTEDRGTVVATVQGSASTPYDADLTTTSSATRAALREA